ncbi:M3 family metallopeptidase [Shewanella psychropiezotolerans]|uniref:M3 family metallopeptidase n=1 Tax=Shewanella psychropiezotolerans TaxID=2593655 RepID=A0ABX5X029_9GAMM|nr:M2 family metallopeptidase [Shewanella psychropiezotolerans]QDO84363.1 M3 family metallopeptidase [Shewanella psychropiezotolerans]
MLRSIFVIALSSSLIFTTAVKAAVSPLPLLVEQCLQLQSPGDSFAGDSQFSHVNSATVTEPDEALIKQSHTLEASLLSLFNIKDRLQYYRSYPLPPLYQESLLQCQLHLADMMAETLNSPWLTQLTNQLATAANNKELSQLLNRFDALEVNHLSLAQKSQLHTAQASIKQGLRTQQLTLRFTEQDCQLNTEYNKSTMTNGVGNDTKNKHSKDPKSSNAFNLSIAAYLIKQDDTVCQKRVWQAYQGRAKEKNQPALERILQLRTLQAHDKGFADYASFSLAKQFLSTPELVKIFLDSQTEVAPTAPWSLGYYLSQSKSMHMANITAAELVDKIQVRAETLGFDFETVTGNIQRVWYQGRLLGDIFIELAKRSKIHILRAPVLGRQFGQVQLSMKQELSRIKDKQDLIKAYASALSALSLSSHYYLVNTIGETLDTSNIGELWLALYLAEGLIEPYTELSRESSISLFAKQLKVFRAKVALDFYSNTSLKPYKRLDVEFIESFTGEWTSLEDYPYNFYAIVTSGPLYYQELWQASLSQYLYQSTKHCENQPSVYNTLVVNEDSKPINQRLKILLGEPVDALSLIKRIQDGFSYQEKFSQDQYTFTCPI